MAKAPRLQEVVGTQLLGLQGQWTMSTWAKRSQSAVVFMKSLVTGMTHRLALLILTKTTLILDPNDALNIVVVTPEVATLRNLPPNRKKPQQAPHPP